MLRFEALGLSPFTDLLLRLGAKHCTPRSLLCVC